MYMRDSAPVYLKGGAAVNIIRGYVLRGWSYGIEYTYNAIRLGKNCRESTIKTTKVDNRRLDITLWILLCMQEKPVEKD